MSAVLAMSLLDFEATPKQKISMRKVHFKTVDLINDLVVGITYNNHQCSINLTNNTFLCDCQDRSCRRRACVHVLKLNKLYYEIRPILEKDKFWRNDLFEDNTARSR